MQLEKEPFDLHGVLDDVRRSCAETKAKDVLDIVFDVDQRVPVLVEGDSAQVALILSNLLDCAQGLCAKDAFRVRIRAEKEGEKRVVLFFDIANPEASSQEEMIYVKDEHAGPALNTAEKLIGMMGGRLLLFSGMSEGSIFFFDLHFGLCEQAFERGAPLPSDVFEAYPIKTLIVDDSTISLLLLEKILERFKCQVEKAENGAEAVALICKNAYDIVFMDCQMPVLNGFEATKEIRRLEAEQGRRTYIVAVTANSMTGDRDECFAAGMDDYIQKPLYPERVAEILRSRSARA